MFRRYLDGGAFGRSYHDKGSWKTEINTVEIWSKYITPVHHYDYNNVVIADVMQMPVDYPEFKERYDIVWMGDIIEHMPMDDGIRLLAKVREWIKPGGHVLIVTPTRKKQWMKGVMGNPHEAHKSIWTLQDFISIKGFIIRVNQSYDDKILVLMQK